MPSRDFNDDGRDDILWRNVSTGEVTNWLGQPDGSFISNPDSLDPFAVGKLVGIGDFDGDLRADTLWRQDNGDVFLSLTIPEGTFFFIFSLGFVSKVADVWHVAGTGDFNGDGRDDVLWRHDNGAVSTWFDQANFVFVDNLSTRAYQFDTAWQIAGTGDFNGDGRDDVLWRHNDGTVTDWLGQANGTFVSNAATAAYSFDTAWQVAATGDFNGDGRDDVLWRHNDGTVTNWLGQANGTFVSNAATAAYSFATAWHVAQSGDFNGDGRDDVLWRHDDGTVTDWLGRSDGSFISNSATAAYGVDTAWQIQPDPSGAGFWDY